MSKALDSGGLGYLLGKLKAWATGAFAPISHTHTASEAPGSVTGVKGNAESSYRTGNVNVTAGNVGALAEVNEQIGTYDISMRPFVDQARANRLAFLPASQVIIEKTTDGGTTWTDYGSTDSNKANVFSVGGTLNIPLLNGARSTQCAIRVTITGMRYDVPSGTAETEKYAYWGKDYVLSQERYFNVREWWFWVGSNSDSIGLKIERATGAAPDSWITVYDNIANDASRLQGWSGSSWVRAGWGVTFGGGTTQTGNSWNWRLTFTSKYNQGKTAFTETTNQSIYKIRCYGDNVWGVANQMMGYDHLYSYSADQSATFPSNIYPKSNGTGQLGASGAKWGAVYATTFYGALTGNVTGNCSGTAQYADKPTGFLSRSTSMAWGNQTGTVLTCLATPAGGGLGFRDNNPSSGQVSMTIDGTVYVREGMKRVLDESDLPLSIANGGTGATTAAAAWTALGGGAIGKKASLAASDIPAHASSATTYGAGSDSNYGHVKLSASTSSTSGTGGGIAATPSAVKSAYDLANTANGTANSALSVAQGALVFDTTYSISDGTATFSAHVYQGGEEVTSDYADADFTWFYRLGTTDSTVSLGTGKTKAVTITTLGYGGCVGCTFDDGN